MISVAALKATWTAFNDDKASRLASAIAYSAIFSLVPLLILCITLGGALLGLQNGGHGHHVAEDALLNAVARHTGRQSAGALRELITASFNRPRNGLLAQIAAWITFIIGAMGFFGTLQDALNTVWNIERINGGFRKVLRDRLVSLAMLLFVSILILASLGIAGATIGIGNSILVKVVNQILLIGCAGQRMSQEGLSPSGARMRGAVSKSGSKASLADKGTCRRTGCPERSGIRRV